MDRKLVCALAAMLALQIIGAAQVTCPNDPNCVCGGTLAVELNCSIDGKTVKINLLADTYINIKCENTTSLDYSKLPTCANRLNTFKSVSFKDCPLPASSFKEVLNNIGVSKTTALIFQNANNLSGYFDRKHFAGLQDLTKLLLSINGVSHLPDNLFMDINKLTWLNIRSNTINLSEELFKPLEKLETLEISHNHMTNITSNLFSHLSYLRKLSLWQSNVTWFSKDLFTGVDVLEELDLSSNGLNELPSTIFKPLRKLKKLTLFSNKFSSLPQNLFKHNEELETVVILNNDEKLKEMPKHLFGGLGNLKQIYMQRCGIEKLPYDMFASSSQVTNISLAYNDIQELPESIFNDQINLLELDLSYNKLNSLEPKLFSSLVRLERLNLNHNNLFKVCGSTFSSLLSLIYLDMEYNNLKTISAELFSNNKQKMSISLAYNKLDFQENDMRNGSLVVTKKSPFAHTFNLRLLNLSHNCFKLSFEDWWYNGHDNLDITHNDIQNLSVEFQNSSYRNLLKKPKQAWVSENPISCKCENYMFIDFIKENFKTKIMDTNNIQCPLWARASCHLSFKVIIVLVIASICLYIAILVTYIVYKKHISTLLKRQEYTLSEEVYMDNNALIVSHHPDDRKFVFEEVLPSIKLYTKSLMYYNNDMANIPTIKQKIYNWIKKTVKNRDKPITLVIFSPNYLMLRYSHINIKKIRSEMKKANNTVYIFVDVEPENSVYAFLKDQRDKRNSVIWDEPDFWNKFSAVTDIHKIGCVIQKLQEASTPVKGFYGETYYYPEMIYPLVKTDRSQNMNNQDTPSHEKVFALLNIVR